VAEIDAFLAMGGYAPFVWPAFGITAAVLIALAVASRRALRSRESVLQALQREVAAEGRRRGR
jgi:heme exporter protein D